jgi:hypothetical protein
VEHFDTWLKISSFMREELDDGLVPSNGTEIVQALINLRYLPRYVIDACFTAHLGVQLEVPHDWLDKFRDEWI